MTDAVGHIHIGQVGNTVRRFNKGQPQRVGNATFDGLFGSGFVKLHAMPQKVVGVNPAQHHVGIGNGGFGAALTVTNRSRHGLRALRANPQRANLVEPGNRTAASPNGVDIQRGA